MVAPMTDLPHAPAPFATRAADGFEIRGHTWRAAAGDERRPVVVVNAATAVRSRYYARFAGFLAGQGCDVVTYDYRGIGESRPPRLRGFRAGWTDWGQLDFEAVLDHVARAFPGRPVDVVAHSIGGFVIGLAPSSHRIRRIVTVGAQFAYWRDYAARARWPMVAKWHVAMPAVTAVMGYFPGRRLGWLEDVPAGVVRDWSRMKARFESSIVADDRSALAGRFAAVTAPILAIGLADDPFGTVAAVDRLLAYYAGSPRTHLRIAPAAVGAPAIGHFAFFHDRFRETLWPLPLAWLRTGRLPEPAIGTLLRSPAGADCARVRPPPPEADR